MHAHGSVSLWLQQLKAGELAALGQLHARYWPFMCRLAARKLQGAPRRAHDEEDAAQDALLGFYQTLRQGGFPELNNRHDLLAVLSMITARKVASRLEHEARKKRGGGSPRGESAWDWGDQGVGMAGIEQVAGKELSPDEAVTMSELYRKCLDALPEGLRPYAELYLAGHTYTEIALQLGCVKRTVERKIPLILSLWKRLVNGWVEMPEPGDS